MNGIDRHVDHNGIDGQRVLGLDSGNSAHTFKVLWTQASRNPKVPGNVSLRRNGSRVRTTLAIAESRGRALRALRETNARLIKALLEKDQIIAWLSGCYSVNEYRDE